MGWCMLSWILRDLCIYCNYIIYIYKCTHTHIVYICGMSDMGFILRDVCRIYGQWKEFSEICWYVQNMGVSKTLDLTIKYGKLVCNYQVQVLKQTIKNGGDFIGKKCCYLSNIVENYHETRVNYQTKWESNIGIQTWWGKFPVEVLTGKHRREWSMFDLWCVWLQEVLVRIQWESGGAIIKYTARI